MGSLVEVAKVFLRTCNHSFDGTLGVSEMGMDLEIARSRDAP